MNTSSVDNNETPDKVTPPDVPVPVSDEQSVEAEAVPAASTIPTEPPETVVPPLFVPAVLPAQTEEPVVSEGVVLPDSPVDVVEEAIADSAVKPESEPEAESPETTLPSVEFSPPPDAKHSASLTLELRCLVPGTPIRYALDADDVGEDGLLYNPAQKIFLTQTTSIAARTFVDGQRGPLTVGRFEIAKPTWQKLEPTDQSDPTTHEECDETMLEGPWQLAAASVRGKLHAHRGGWREDAFRHGLAHASDGTYSVIVVSDGAGSVPLSRVGSNLLCQVALDFLLSSLTDTAPLSDDSKTLAERDLPVLRGLLVESARLALQKLREEAARRSRPLSDFSSTLLILVRREWNGQQLCSALQSGDGSIALWNDDDTLTILGEADHGEHTSETRFLTTDGMEAELPARVKFSIRSNLRAVAVMTDGVADDFFPEPVRFPELFGAVLPVVTKENLVSPGAALLEWINYEKKGSSDDRALVVCWQDSGAVSDAIAAEGSDGNL